MDSRLTQPRHKPLDVKVCLESLEALRAEYIELTNSENSDAETRLAEMAGEVDAWITELEHSRQFENRLMARHCPGAQRMPQGGWKKGFRNYERER